MSDTIALRSVNDFEEFRKTLKDPNVIRGYSFDWYDTPIDIKGTEAVYFIGCTITQLHPNPCTLPTVHVFTSTAAIHFEECVFEGKTFLHLQTPPGAPGKCSLYLDNPRQGNIYISCQSGLWNITANWTAYPLIINGADSVHICGSMPPALCIDNAKSVEIINIGSNIDSNIILDAVRRISLYNVHCKNAHLAVKNSYLLDMSFTDVSLRLVNFKLCEVNVLHAVNTSIKLIGAAYSVCKSVYKTAFSRMPSAMTKSAGFPEDDQLVLYKSVWMKRPFRKKCERIILKLLVKPNAQKHLGDIMANDRQVRVDAAIPVKLYSLPDLKPIKKPRFAKLISMYDSKYTYRIGKVATPRVPFDTSDEPCASGIHGFISIDEAKDYYSL